MLKNRLIPIIIVKDDLIVQSFNFRKYLPIGSIEMAIEFFMSWDVDEIIVLDINASKDNRPPKLEIIEKSIKNCFVPLTIGGGIRNMDDIKNALRSGADKVSINEHAYRDLSFIEKAARRFGSQCITVSVDTKKVGKEYNVFIRNGQINTGMNVTDWIKSIERAGAGEILINSIERDGSRLGYDLQLLNLVSSNANIPVIACGGVGNTKHLADGILYGSCQAVAAANIFQHTEHSTIAAKAVMRKAGVPVRLNSDVKYDQYETDYSGRLI